MYLSLPYVKGTNVTIFNNGEGQNPADFPDTFLSIAHGNKNDIPFVQGKYNFGETGAVVFCGETHRYQMFSYQLTRPSMATMELLDDGSDEGTKSIYNAIAKFYERILKDTNRQINIHRGFFEKYLGFTFLKNGSGWKVKPTNEKKKKLKEKLSEYLKRGKPLQDRWQLQLNESMRLSLVQVEDSFLLSICGCCGYLCKPRRKIPPKETYIGAITFGSIC